MQLNDNQELYMKKKAKWFFEPLVYTDAVFLTNEFLKEHGEKPLSLSQCQDLRQNAMEKGSSIRLQDAIDNGVDYQDIVNRTISNNVSAMFDKTDETGKVTLGIVDTYLKENGLMPKNLKNNETLAEYARTHEYSEDFMCKKYEALKYTAKGKDNKAVSKDLRYLDLFGKTYIPAGYTADKQPRWETIDTACLEAVQAYINTDAQAQTSYLELSTEEKKDYRPYHLSRKDMFVYHDDMKELFHIHHDTQEQKNDESYKYMTVNHSRQMPLFTYNDRTGLSQLRPFIGSDTINQYTDAQDGKRIIKNEVSQEQFQSIRNAVAIFSELNKRGLHYTVEPDKNYGELRAIIDGTKMDIRVYDEMNPNMVGRMYKEGVASYFKSDFYYKNAHATVMPNEQMCRDLLAYNLGEKVESPYKQGDHTYIVGEQGPITVVNGNQVSKLKKTYANKPPVEYNASYVSNNNTNAFYDVENYKIGNRNVQAPITIYSTKFSSIDKKETKFSSPEEGKQYLVEKMLEANSNFKTMLLGEDFGQPDNEGKIKFEVPESTDAKISALQNNYQIYFEHDDAVLRFPEETTEDFKARVDEVKNATPEAQLVANSFFNVSPEQKIEGINEHYEHSSKTMFGKTNIDGLINDIKKEESESPEDFAKRESIIMENNRSVYAKVATEDNPLILNVSNIIKYSDAETDDVIKAIQAAGPSANIDFISEDGDFSMNRIREKIVTYNDNNDMSLLNNRELSPFMEHVGKTVKSCIESQGCSVNDIRIDNQGIIKYDGKRDIAMTNLTSNGSSSEVRFSGTIGQIFEPDENGVIVTRFNHDNNHSIIPGYKATVERQRFGEHKSVEERTICKGYEQLLDEQLRLKIHSNFMNQNFDSTLNNTELNNIYRHLYDERFPEDYKSHFRSLGMDDELMEATIKTLKGSIRYDSSYKESSTLNARLNANKSNIINDLNNDDYSITGRDMSCLADSTPGYLDPIATSTGMIQGLSRYLVSGAYVDESGHIQPARKSDGSIDTDAKAPLLELNVCRNMDYNPFDRQQMTFSNLMHCLAVEDKVGVAHMTLGGWNMDDGYVISKEFAERHLVPSRDISTTKNLNSKLIEAQICNSAGLVNSYQIEDGTSHVMFMGRDYDITPIYQTLNEKENTKTEAELCSELIKEKMIENNIALRPMQVGDKICDFNGNKGVCTLIVDRNMSEQLAQKLQLEKEVALFHNNEQLDIVGAPFTAPSRMNAGTARGMMENPQDLVLFDGSIQKGAMGYIPIIVTDMTVDEKTHIYDDEELAKGKGRKASSQLAWSLQARNADKLMKYCYGDNIDNLRSCREKMIALGMDLDEDYKIIKGFHYHKDAKGEYEHRDLIEIGEPEIYVSNGAIKRNMVKKDEPLKDVKNQLQQKGGFMKIPFPITLASGIETIKDEDEQYLLPVLSPEYRNEQSYDDNSSILHDYTRSYVNIARYVLDYKARQKQIAELDCYDSDNPSDKIVISNSLSPDQLKEKWQDEMEKFKQNAQKEYDECATKMKELNFEGKYNIWKRSIMSHRLPDSATAVWTGDPRLKLEEIGMSKGMMDTLSVKDGDNVLVWRDPQLRPEGVAYMKVKERDPEDLPLTGVAINPVMDKRFDGDFDGDSVAVVNINDTKYSKAVEEAESRVAFMQTKYNQTQNEDDLKKLNRAQDNLLLSKEKLGFIHEVQNQAQELFGIENTLTDLGTTKNIIKEREDITFALNMGLDIASAKSYFNENGMHVGIEDEQNKAKDAIIQGNNKEALNILNNMVHTCFKDGHGSDIVLYDSIENHLESQNRIIVDHKAKGKIDKMVEYAKYLGADIYFVNEENTKVHMDELVSVQKKDKEDNISHTYKIDTSEGSMTDYEVAFIRANTENSTLPPELLEELKNRKEEIKDMFRQVEQATAIKSFGTGIAGAFSQRGVKVNANEALLDTIELTYGATQGILQAKHDAVEAEQKYTILRETLPALWKGNQIEHREDGSWVPKLDENGKQVKATKEQFIEQYYELCTSKDGLIFDISKERVQNVADALYKPYINSKGKEIAFRSPYADYGCTLDRLAYGGDFDTLVEKTGHSLFETKRGEMFRPDGNIAVAKNRTNTSDFYSKTSMVYSKEAAIAAGLEKVEKRLEERKETERIIDNINKNSNMNSSVTVPQENAVSTNKTSVKSKTAVLIGSRPDKLYGYREKDGGLPKYDMLQHKIFEKLEDMYEDGYKNFATTGLQGFNMLVFDAVEDFKKTHSDVRNILIVPTRDNGKYWCKGEDEIFSNERYYRNLEKADRVFDASNGSPRADYAAMDKMVSKCDTIVAMYAEGDESWKMTADERKRNNLSPSATANTMKAAHKAGSNILMFEPPTDTVAFKEVTSRKYENSINKTLQKAESIAESQLVANNSPDYKDA